MDDRGSGFAFGAACTVVAAHRLTASLPIAMLVTVPEVLIYPRTYSYPKVLAYAPASWAIVALASRPSRRRIAVTAALVAVAFLFRHDHGLFIGIGAAVCLAVAAGRAGWRIAFDQIAALTAMTAALLLPWTVFIMLNGGLIRYFEGGIEYSRAEAALPLSANCRCSISRHRSTRSTTRKHGCSGSSGA